MAGWSFHGRAGPLKRPCGCLSLLRSLMSGVRRAFCACTCPQRTLPRLLSQPSCALPTPAGSPSHPPAPVGAAGQLSTHLPLCARPSTHLSLCLSVDLSSLRLPVLLLTHPPACLCFPSPLGAPVPASIICPCVCPAPTCRPPVYTSVHLSIHLLIRLSTPPSCFRPSPVCLFHTSVGGWCPCGAGKLTASGPVRVWQ